MNIIQAVDSCFNHKISKKEKLIAIATENSILKGNDINYLDHVERVLSEMGYSGIALKDERVLYKTVHLVKNKIIAGNYFITNKEGHS